MPKHYGGEKEENSNPKPKASGGKLSDKQKSQLKKHMEKMEKDGMSKSEMKSHRMKLMSRMRKGSSVGRAHKELMSG